MPLYKRPDSPYWWVSIGRKTRLSTGTEDRAQAQEFERVLTERLWRRDKLGDRSAISWREVAQRWLKDSQRARKRDREFLDFLDQEIGEYAVSDVAEPDAIEELRQTGLAEGWSHSTVDRMMRTVRAVLRRCVTWRYLDHAPHVPMFGEPPAEPRFLTPQQFARLRAELPQHLRDAADFAVMTLLRMRAQSYLTWDRVDLVNARGWIPGAQQKASKAHGFPLSRDAVKLLRKIRMRSPRGERVFQYEGRPIDNFNTAAFRKAAERAGVDPLRWHDLRHTGASWAVQSGHTLPEVQALGDWKSYASVQRYAHLAPQNAAAAAQSVSRLLHVKHPKAARRKA